MVEPGLPIPRVPELAQSLLRRLPLGPLELALGLLTRQIAARHPGLLRRLGPAAAGKRLALDPTDLPLVLLLAFEAGIPRLEVLRTLPDEVDGRIAGPLAALLGMVHGALDGDALFFARAIVVEGDAAAAVALRNAVDAAELDLAEEALAPLGPLGRLVEPAVDLLARWTGVPLRRLECGR